MWIKRIRAWGRVLFFFFSSINGAKCNIMDASQSTNKILEGKSIIRFGDGEFGIYKKRGIHYQDWSEELLNEFLKIKKDYVGGNSNYILAVPKEYMTMSGVNLLKRRALVASWSEARYDFVRTFPQNMIYADAFLFQKGNEKIFGRIWGEDIQHDNVIFIHNSQVYAQEFEEKYNKKVFFVKCPERNSFECIASLFNSIDTILSQLDLSADNTELVISAGPAGKVIAYNYTNKGFLCIDAGHCWDNPLRGEGKYCERK